MTIKIMKMPNAKIVFDDEEISWEAKGIFANLCFCKSIDWEIDIRILQKESTDSYEVIESAINELIEYGYLIEE